MQYTKLTEVPMWQQVRRTLVNPEFSSKKRDQCPKQVLLSIISSSGRNSLAFKFGGGFPFKEVGELHPIGLIRKLFRLEQCNTLHKSISSHRSKVKCCREEPNIFKMSFTYSGATFVKVILSICPNQ